MRLENTMQKPGAFFCALLVFFIPAVLPAAESPLTNITSVLSLSPERAGNELPVRLTAAVTYADPHSGILFVEDEAGGIFVGTRRALPALRFGDLIEIEGQSDPGVHLRAIHKDRKTLERPQRFSPLLCSSRTRPLLLPRSDFHNSVEA